MDGEVKPNTEPSLPKMRKNIPLVLKCGWSECNFKVDDIDEFQSHIAVHLQDYDSEYKEQDLRELGCYFCKWKDCFFSTNDTSQFLRHGFFHGFHTKLKCYGDFIVNTRGVQPCMLDTRNANVLPDLAEPFICRWTIEAVSCLAEFNDCQSFYDHVDAHVYQVNASESHHCYWDNCTSNLSNSVTLKNHLKKHTQERSVSCPNCGGMFCTNNSLLTHCKGQSATDNVKKYSCSHCPEKFVTKRLLRDHVKQHVNRYRCPHCEVSTSYPSKLSLHIQQCHGDSKPFTCWLCGHRANTKYDLRKHVSTHEEKITCSYEGCDFVCSQNYAMNYHIREKHSNRSVKKYVCHICDERFCRGPDLLYHLESVHEYILPSGSASFRFNLEGEGRIDSDDIRY